MSNIPRKVPFSTIIKLIKTKPIPTIIGTAFTGISILVFIAFSIFFNPLMSDDSIVDYDLINKQGIATTAIITDIEVQKNISINRVHPYIIYYTYSQDGVKFDSQYRTLSENKAKGLTIGDEIQIKTLEGNSVIQNLKPFRFPTEFLKYIPLVFFLIGLPFLIYAFYTLQKEIMLYKNGRVAKGKIISMIQKKSIPISNAALGVFVQYQYTSRSGHNLTGESFTSDHSILNENEKGDFIPIFISENNEENSTIVPKLESIKNNWNIKFDL
ncbi:MAG: hypothetical protein P1U56_06515 [Saprospiraceae bacterium]|nr:hypothetical protein [Saprospiraceae bacterium]